MFRIIVCLLTFEDALLLFWAQLPLEAGLIFWTFALAMLLFKPFFLLFLFFWLLFWVAFLHVTINHFTFFFTSAALRPDRLSRQTWSESFHLLCVVMVECCLWAPRVVRTKMAVSCLHMTTFPFSSFLPVGVLFSLALHLQPIWRNVACLFPVCRDDGYRCLGFLNVVWDPPFVGSLWHTNTPQLTMNKWQLKVQKLESIN